MRDLVAILAAARLTRLVVSDDLGQWWLIEPVGTWVADHPEHERWHRYLDGLTCPFCVGFWIGLGVLGLDRLLLDRSTALARGWRLIRAALALNYVAGNLNTRLDG